MAAVNQLGAPNPAGPGPDQETQELKKLCTAMVSAAKVVTDQWMDVYETALNYLYNNQLHDKDRQEGWQSVQLNTLFPAITQEMAVLAQRKPDIEVLPEESGDKSPEDVKKAEAWRGILKYDFMRTLKMPRLTREAILDGKIGGYWVAFNYWEDEGYWDEEARRWVGVPVVKLLHQRKFGMDPNAEKLDEAEFCYCQVERSLEWCKQRWKGNEQKEILDRAVRADQDVTIQGGYPKSQLKASVQTDRGVKENKAEGQIAELVRQARASYKCTGPSDDPAYKDAGQLVLVTGVWFRDRTTEKLKRRVDVPREELLEAGAVVVAEDGRILVNNPDAEWFKGKKLEAGQALELADWPYTTEEVNAPKYPRGRVVWMVNEEILNPKPEEQRWPYKRWPFNIGVNMILPHVWQGLNGVEMGRGTQDWINVSAAHMLNWLCYFCDPALMVKDGTIIQKVKRKLRRLAGQILHLNSKSSPGDVGYLNGPPLQQGAIALYELMLRQSQDTNRVHATQLGGREPGGQTATESANQQANAQTWQGMQILFMDEWVEDVMRSVAEMRQHHMEAGDTVRLLGEKSVTQLREISESELALDFDIRLEVGTAMPFDKERKKLDAKELRAMFPQNPAIMRKVLKAYDVDDIEDVLRNEQIVQQMAQFAAIQQANTAGGGAPGGPVAPSA